MRKMKDSGIPWIEEIPQDWIVSRFCYETWVRARLGWKGLKADEYVDDGYIFLSTPNIKTSMIDYQNVNYINQQRFEESPEIKLSVGDVLLAKDGSTLGTTNIVRYLPHPATVNSSIAVITPYERLDSIYLYYFIKSHYIQTEIDIKKDGMGVPHLFQRDINKFRLLLPQVNIQQTIAKYLDFKCSQIDNAISIQQQSAEKLREYKRAIITRAVTKGLKSNVPMRESDISWISEYPITWKISKVKVEFDNLDGQRRPISAEVRVAGEYDYYGASGVIDKIGEYIFEETLLLIGEDGANLELRNLPLVYIACGKYWVNNHAHILRPKPSNDLKYMAYYLESIDLYQYLSGSTQPKLTQNNLSNIPIVVPSHAEQQEIATYLDNKCAKIDTAISEKETLIEKLQEYKKSLIYECVTGKREV